MTTLPLQAELDRRWLAGADGVPALVDWLLSETSRSGASDLHVEPWEDGILFRWRRDGCLTDAGAARGPLAANVVQRLKVLAGLPPCGVFLRRSGRARSAAFPLRPSASGRPLGIENGQLADNSDRLKTHSYHLAD